MSNEIENGSFVETLEGLAFGSSLMDIDRKLKKCVEASAKTGKMSTLTITLKLKPVQGADTPQFEIADTCRANIPEAEHGATVMFSSDDGILSSEHPGAIAKRKRLAQAEAAKAAESGEHLKAIKALGEKP